MAEQRWIQYGDRKMEMEPGMTLDQAKELMARHFPELADPKVEKKESGDKVIYVFSKKAGHKGRGRRRARLAACRRRLERLPEHPVVDAPLIVYREKEGGLVTAGEFTTAGQCGRTLRTEMERVVTLRQVLLDLPALPSGGPVL